MRPCAIRLLISDGKKDGKNTNLATFVHQQGVQAGKQAGHTRFAPDWIIQVVLQFVYTQCAYRDGIQAVSTGLGIPVAPTGFECGAKVVS